MARAKFLVYTDKSFEWRWRLVSANNEIVADSGQGFKTAKEARSAIKAMKRTAWLAGVEKRG